MPELLFPVWPAWCCHVQAVNGLDPFATLELYSNYSPFERLAPAEVSGTLSSSMSCPSCETKCSAKDSLEDRWGPKMAALILGIFIHPPNISKYRTACITPNLSNLSISFLSCGPNQILINWIAISTSLLDQYILAKFHHPPPLNLVPRRVLIQDAEAIKSQIFHLGFWISSWFWYNPGKLQLPGHLLHEGHLQKKTHEARIRFQKETPLLSTHRRYISIRMVSKFWFETLDIHVRSEIDENSEIMIHVRVATSLFQRREIYHPPSFNAITNQFQWSSVNCKCWPYKHSLIYQSQFNHT